jgi:hypothetical protein
MARVRPVVRPGVALGPAWLGLALLCLVPPCLAGCGASPPPGAAPTPTTLSRQDDRDRLSGLAAAAKDRRYVATYLLTTPLVTTPNRAGRMVTVAVATDGSWVVAVPAGALSGLADIAVFSSAAGLFQCALGSAAGTSGSRSDLPPVSPGCVQVTRLTAAADPRVQHVFTDWIDPLVDRETALSVTAVPGLAGASGSCFSVESNSAALTPPVDPGIYCYDTDGMLTGVRASFGTLTLTGAVAPGPPTITMPAPVVSGAPLPMTAPPPPPTPTSTPGATATQH